MAILISLQSIQSLKEQIRSATRGQREASGLLDDIIAVSDDYFVSRSLLDHKGLTTPAEKELKEKVSTLGTTITEKMFRIQSLICPCCTPFDEEILFFDENVRILINYKSGNFVQLKKNNYFSIILTTPTHGISFTENYPFATSIWKHLGFHQFCLFTFFEKYFKCDCEVVIPKLFWNHDYIEIIPHIFSMPYMNNGALLKDLKSKYDSFRKSGSLE